MFDVFYIGPKPNLFPHEQEVQNIEQAQSQSRTRYCWVTTYLADYSAWDWLWEPPPWQSHYTHVWPSQHHDFSGTYLVPKTNNIEYHFHQEIIPHRARPQDFKSLVTPVEFDWTWAPHPLDPPYIYVFGNQWHTAEKQATVEYHVPGAREHKYMRYPQARLLPCETNWHALMPASWDTSWKPDPGDPPLIYVFGNQWHMAVKMPTVEYRVPGATDRKYMQWPRAQLPPRATNWHIPANIDAATVDLSWCPDPGSPPYIYQFGTQHQKTGGPVYTVPGATEVKYVQAMANTRPMATAIYEIDHMDGRAGQIPNTTRRIRYFDNYRDTLIRLAKSIGDEHEYVWVCSSVCDYTDFDFTWHPEQWQAHMLHVFASNHEKFGDTFFMHVPSFAAQAERKALLEWYDVNFIDNPVPRRPMPVIIHDQDTHVEAVKTQDWSGPLAVFAIDQDVAKTNIAVPLWRDQKKLVPIATGAAAVIVPRTARPHIRDQLYDYEFIDKNSYSQNPAPRLDIVFVHNNEPKWFERYTKLVMAVGTANKIHVSGGVQGRVAAYHAAAKLSTTPWFFAVFAKLEVNPGFDWSWQPDRMQQPKHYIFHALNPITNLVYGHQAMIAYNRKLVLANSGRGLDFTLDDAHEVVPLISGTAWYNDTPFMAWRTAFREALKLRDSLPDVENEHRLKRWLSPPEPAAGYLVNHDWSQRGAEDAMEYYDSVSGDFVELRRSYDWAWLASYAYLKRGLAIDQ